MPIRPWLYQKPDFEFRQRRKAVGGIEAKSRSGDIGATWWSKRFVAALESFTEGSRLTRGRSYARTGQVMNLRIEPGQVQAEVQGSRRWPYDVALMAQPFSTAQWQQVEAAMAGEAIFLAQLLAGEIPRDIERAFERCGLSLFPSSTKELRTECSCPDVANPCKHVAATFYILAERFDEDPFLMLAWRGRPRDALLASLNALREAAPAPEEAAPAPRPRDYWRAAPDALEPRAQPDQTAPADAVPRQLGPLTGPGGEDLASALLPAWARIAAAARARG